MAFVSRTDSFGDKYLDTQPWEYLTKAEKVRVGYFRVSLAISTLALLPLTAPSVIGEESEKISEAKQQAPLLAAVKSEYTDATIADKFRINFIKPVRKESGEYEVGGSGLRNLVAEHDANYAMILVGRSCLAGTAYDTTPYKGNASAVAALQVSDSKVTVHPAGSEAAPLTFKVNNEGDFLPTKNTAETLNAYDCRYLGGLPLRTAFTDETRDIEWTYQGALDATS